MPSPKVIYEQATSLSRNAELEPKRVRNRKTVESVFFYPGHSLALVTVKGTERIIMSLKAADPYSVNFWRTYFMKIKLPHAIALAIDEQERLLPAMQNGR